MSQAACNDFLTATSILVEASALPPDQPGQTKYFIVIDPNALSIGPAEGGVRNVQIELATCMFNARGLPLQYNRQSIGQKLTETEYQSIKAHGISHTISFVPKPETARVRLLVCDSRTGMIGSVDLPYPAQVLSTASAKPEKGADEVPKGSQASPPPQPSPHTVKFHGNGGRNGNLEWSSEVVCVRGWKACVRERQDDSCSAASAFPR